MTTTMQAAVVERFGQPLVLREWDVPQPGPGQILVKTEACGVCHTDLHAARGDFPVQAGRPYVPGHEGVGRIAAVRAGVTSVKEGDRAGTRQDMVEALGFAADGQVQADIELQLQSAINQVFDRLERGEVASRVVLDCSLGHGHGHGNGHGHGSGSGSDRPSSARWS